MKWGQAKFADVTKARLLTLLRQDHGRHRGSRASMSIMPLWVWPGKQGACKPQAVVLV